MTTSLRRTLRSSEPRRCWQESVVPLLASSACVCRGQGRAPRLLLAQAFVRAGVARRRDEQGLARHHVAGSRQRVLHPLALHPRASHPLVPETPEEAEEQRLAPAALPQTPKTTRSIRTPQEPKSMCARSLETTTKFASVLLHATRRLSPPLETAHGVLGFMGGYDSSRHTGSVEPNM